MGGEVNNLPEPNDKDRKTATSADRTTYHSVKHPNMIKPVNMSGSVIEEEPATGLTAWFNNIDEKYIRPCCIYKYKKVKKRQQFEFEDVLKEYQMI